MPITPSLNLNAEIECARKILPVRIMRQDADFSCGIACARMLLEYYGISDSNLKPPVDMHPDQMVELLRAGGLRVTTDERGTLETLYDFIDDGCPVLVLSSMWEGCWVLVIGYEHSSETENWRNDIILLANPDTMTSDRMGMTAEKAPDFLSQWREEGLFDRPRERFWLLAHP